ncbi:hypothetical protein MPTK1_5g03490 [Marchantia polymorpha subsp. ruderalis]|uniref:Uncharacterized protein n=2 Tax=Marchantia polymorpha TaxID=3197 RepID=A0AAF6BEJ6_MARPO|nr:hypothetical protein MARPO_0133s0038 [Marchantia polymorpha]BBN10430.1 hypothetical protein Mp_5g03490 [Marchantia polymorpha subsp. ruderalis]|eukprot:PTQ29893.1 hypothetical protein MARPO_0133s0038 [Marchantia polymorpha]
MWSKVKWPFRVLIRIRTHKFGQRPRILYWHQTQVLLQKGRKELVLERSKSEVSSPCICLHWVRRNCQSDIVSKDPSRPLQVTNDQTERHTMPEGLAGDLRCVGNWSNATCSIHCKDTCRM